MLTRWRHTLWNFIEMMKHRLQFLEHENENEFACTFSSDWQHFEDECRQSEPHELFSLLRVSQLYNWFAVGRGDDWWLESLYCSPQCTTTTDNPWLILNSWQLIPDATQVTAMTRIDHIQFRILFQGVTIEWSILKIMVRFEAVN